MDAFLGEIRLFPYNYAPRGWALCQGQNLSIRQLTALYALLGTVYGGDGVSTFGVPNLQGRIMVGVGQGLGLSNYVRGQSGGATTVALSSAQQLPGHTHTLNALNADGTVTTSTSNMPAIAATGQRGHQITANAYASGGTNTAMKQDILSSVGSGAAHNNMQPYVVMNYCICLQGVFPPRS